MHSSALSGNLIKPQGLLFSNACAWLDMIRDAVEQMTMCSSQPSISLLNLDHLRVFTEGCVRSQSPLCPALFSPQCTVCILQPPITNTLSSTTYLTRLLSQSKSTLAACWCGKTPRLSPVTDVTHLMSVAYTSPSSSHLALFTLWFLQVQ